MWRSRALFSWQVPRLRSARVVTLIPPHYAWCRVGHRRTSQVPAEELKMIFPFTACRN
jgi:hypothetical protein